MLRRQVIDHILEKGSHRGRHIQPTMAHHPLADYVKAGLGRPLGISVVGCTGASSIQARR